MTLMARDEARLKNAVGDLPLFDENGDMAVHNYILKKRMCY